MLGYKPSKLNHRLFRLLKLTIGHLSSCIVPHYFQFVKRKSDETSYFFQKVIAYFFSVLYNSGVGACEAPLRLAIRLAPTHD